MKLVALALLTGATLLTGCTGSDTTSEQLATIHGTVTLHGDWPTTGQIQVSLFSQWHTELPVNIAPQGPPDFASDSLASPDPSGQEHVVAFEVSDINPGLYPSLVVGWRDAGTSGLDEPVLGLYGASFATGDTLPSSISLLAGDDLELNFEGELDRVPHAEVTLTGFVNGTVMFVDGWPTSADSVHFDSYYIVLMDSSNPAVPTQPRGQQQITEDHSSFNFSVLYTNALTCHLAVYGFPYTHPIDAYYGGYGWDWDAATPVLTDIVLTPNQNEHNGLVVSCRKDH